MKVRIVTGNPVFAFKGTLFERADGQGKVLDHEVKPALGKELLELDGSPFREIDEDGNVIPNDADVAKAEAAAADLARREHVVPSPTRTEVTVPKDEKPKKTITISKKDKDETPGPVIEKKAEETQTPPTDGSGSASDGTELKSESSDTEGAVEV